MTTIATDALTALYRDIISKRATHVVAGITALSLKPLRRQFYGRASALSQSAHTDAVRLYAYCTPTIH